MSSKPKIAFLLKDELINELALYGISAKPEDTRDALRQQYRQALKQCRRGSLHLSSLDLTSLDSELDTCDLKIKELEQVSGGDECKVRVRARADYMLLRLSRLPKENERVSRMRGRLISLLADDNDDTSDSEFEANKGSGLTEVCTRSEGINTVYIKEKSVILNSLNLKFDGTTCVRVFLERLEELRIARRVNDADLLNCFCDLLDKTALQWYRTNKHNFRTYHDLISSLKEDFDIPDFDYKLVIEIRQRTQAKDESIINYLTTMQAMFSRLMIPMSEKEKLEILLHNIRPNYIKDLALLDIDSIGTLKKYLKKLELAQARSSDFSEPSTSNFNITKDLQTFKNSVANNNKFSKNISEISSEKIKVKFLDVLVIIKLIIVGNRRKRFVLNVEIKVKQVKIVINVIIFQKTNKSEFH